MNRQTWVEYDKINNGLVNEGKYNSETSLFIGIMTAILSSLNIFSRYPHVYEFARLMSIIYTFIYLNIYNFVYIIDKINHVYTTY